MSTLRNINFPCAEIINTSKATLEESLQADQNSESLLLLPNHNSIAFDLDNTLIYSTPLPTQNTSFYIIQEKSRNRTKDRAHSSFPSSVPTTSRNQSPASDDKSRSLGLSQQNLFASSHQKPIYRKVYIQFRPGLIQFMRAVCQNFNILFFTSSERSYAKNVVSKILEASFNDIEENGSNEYEIYYNFYSENIDNILFSREHCVYKNGYEVKDLRITKQSLSNIILVDDMKGCGLLQPFNSVIVPPFYGDADDSFLLRQLMPLLMNCIGIDDFLINVRKHAEIISPDVNFYYQD